MQDYVHGYSTREAERLTDQATTLGNLLHHDIIYPTGSLILECGCGTGAQTLIQTRQSPECHYISMDISWTSLQEAREKINAHQISNVDFTQGDLFHLPFADRTFDHIFICFVLEHLPNPESALLHLKHVLKPGGTITVIEGDHGSWYCYPWTAEAQKTVQCLIDLQAEAGGNSLIGRAIYPLLNVAGFKEVTVSPRMVYVDSSRPDLVEGFSKNTFIAMVKGVKDKAISSGKMDETTWEKGIQDMLRATEKDGTFMYTFFKGVGIKDD